MLAFSPSRNLFFPTPEISPLLAVRKGKSFDEIRSVLWWAFSELLGVSMDTRTTFNFSARSIAKICTSKGVASKYAKLQKYNDHAEST